MKTCSKEHIELSTRIENVRHQMKRSQKENLHHYLRDRELDPWTQLRLESIKSTLDQCKHDFNVIMQVTRTKVNDRSSSMYADTTTDNEYASNIQHVIRVLSMMSMIEFVLIFMFMFVEISYLI
jgi:hypothetical protein